MNTNGPFRQAVILTALSLILWTPSVFGTETVFGLLSRYGHLPKGCVMEGTAQGVPPLHQLSYDLDDGRFILNDRSSYAVPANLQELILLCRSLDKDDRLGISIILNEKNILYGHIPTESRMARAFYNTDMFLISVVFGWTENLGSASLPANYVPLRPRHRKVATVCCNSFSNFRFEEIEGRLECISVDLTQTLVPMSSQRGADGGYLPDFKTLRTGRLEPTDLHNRAHIRQHKLAYLQRRPVAEAVRYGEVAAFLRYLQDQGVSLKRLAERLEHKRCRQAKGRSLQLPERLTLAQHKEDTP